MFKEWEQPLLDSVRKGKGYSSFICGSIEFLRIVTQAVINRDKKVAHFRCANIFRVYSCDILILLSPLSISSPSRLIELHFGVPQCGGQR